MKKDISEVSDVRSLVHSFYAKVQNDELIGSVFSKAVHDWDSHLPVMVTFWSSVLFGTGDYHRQPFPKHMKLDIESQHFERWLSLFDSTVDELFEGEKAEEAKMRAHSIGKIFSMKLDMLRQ